MNIERDETLQNSKARQRRIKERETRRRLNSLQKLEVSNPGGLELRFPFRHAAGTEKMKRFSSSWSSIRERCREKKQTREEKENV